MSKYVHENLNEFINREKPSRIIEDETSMSDWVHDKLKRERSERSEESDEYDNDNMGDWVHDKLKRENSERTGVNESVVGGLVGLLIGTFIVQNTLTALGRENIDLDPFGLGSRSSVTKRDERKRFDQDFEGHWFMDSLTTRVMRKVQSWNYDRRINSIITELMKHDDIKDIVNDPELYNKKEIFEIVDNYLSDKDREWLNLKSQNIIKDQLTANEEWHGEFEGDTPADQGIRAAKRDNAKYMQGIEWETLKKGDIILCTKFVQSSMEWRPPGREGSEGTTLYNSPRKSWMGNTFKEGEYYEVLKDTESRDDNKIELIARNVNHGNGSERIVASGKQLANRFEIVQKDNPQVLGEQHWDDPPAQEWREQEADRRWRRDNEGGDFEDYEEEEPYNLDESLNETTLADMYNEMGTWFNINPEMKAKAEKTGINTENNHQLRELIDGWREGIYDEDPNLLFDELEDMIIGIEESGVTGMNL